MFIVSIRKDLDDGGFEFPEGEDVGVRLKDVLLDEVEDKYFYNRKELNFKQGKVGADVIGTVDVGNYNIANKVYGANSICHTLRAKTHGQLHRVDRNRYRWLTPLECFRLMGFDDEDYYKARTSLEQVFYKGNDKSNSQMYKQAGNSIVVNVLEEIFKKLFK